MRWRERGYETAAGQHSHRELLTSGKLTDLIGEVVGTMAVGDIVG